MHNKEHKIINYDQIKYICNEHYGIYTKYCESCNKDLFIKCESGHKEHKTIDYEDIITNNINKNEEFIEFINKLKNEIDDIIQKLKYILNFYNYLNIQKYSSKIINSNYNINRNYQVLKNINEFIKFNNIIIKDINNINNDIKNLMTIYDKIQIIKYNDNYITAIINIKKEDINKNIKIINSFENYHRYLLLPYYEFYNEKDIKESCEIEINDEIIPFSYDYKFKEERQFIIKYSFNHRLKNNNCMFSDCENITEINFAKFYSRDVTNMRGLFWCCKSLININFSNFLTNNVINMAELFIGCESLKNIDLSNFNTENVINMENIFSGCKSLKKQNVITKDEKLNRKFDNCFIYQK